MEFAPQAEDTIVAEEVVDLGSVEYPELRDILTTGSLASG